MTINSTFGSASPSVFELDSSFTLFERISFGQNETGASVTELEKAPEQSFVLKTFS